MFDAVGVYLYHCTVMLERLPEHIDPIHFADKQSELKGEIELRYFTRLADFLADDNGVVSVALFFSRIGKLSIIEGQVNTKLALKCQNCNQAVGFPVNRDIKLAIVTSIEQAEHLPQDYEPLLVGESKVAVKDLVEDELLLSIPDYPKHQHQCYDSIESHKHKMPVVEEQSNHQNPFSVLAKLKNTGE